jgi:hypothetical protein
MRGPGRHAAGGSDPARIGNRRHSTSIDVQVDTLQESGFPHDAHVSTRDTTHCRTAVYNIRIFLSDICRNYYTPSFEKCEYIENAWTLVSRGVLSTAERLGAKDIGSCIRFHDY